MPLRQIGRRGAAPTLRHDARRAALRATRELNELLTTARREGRAGFRLWAGAHRPAEALERQLAGHLTTRGRGPSPLAASETTAPSPSSSRTVAAPTSGPAARLDVAASPHGRVRSYGWAELFPAGSVHARRSVAAVAGNNCVLESTTHYHIQRARLSPGRLASDPAAREALRLAAADPTDGRIDDLMRALRRIHPPAPAEGPDRRGVPVRARHTTLISDAQAVQIGDGSRMTVDTRFVVEETRIPLVGLLVADRELTRAFVESLREPEPGALTSRFLARVLAAAGGVDDRTVLDHLQGVPRSDTRLLSMFGVAHVDRAEAVMVGVNNDLRTRATVHRPGLHRRTVLHDLAKVSDLARPVPSRPTLGGEVVRGPVPPSRPRAVPDPGRRRDTGRGGPGLW